MKLNEFKIEEVDFNKSKLIPAIIQDANSLKVLMLGYMNRESLQITLEKGLVTFYSRSREQLWTKGESSGNFLYAKEIFLDCDNDTILIYALPKGPTCHTGSVSCFKTDDTQGFIRELEHVIKERKINMPQESYTVKLFNAGVNRMAQKVGEEAVETVIEAINCNDERFVYEASDLIYHLLVLLISKGMDISTLEKELYKRHK